MDFIALAIAEMTNTNGERSKNNCMRSYSAANGSLQIAGIACWRVLVSLPILKAVITKMESLFHSSLKSSLFTVLTTPAITVASIRRDSSRLRTG